MRRHHARLAIALTVAGAMAGAIAVPASGSPAGSPLSSGRGSFLSVCEYSHRALDDPIVMPGMFGMSHSHDFAGNRTTDASSTLTSLRAGGTTCDRRADTAAYWAPTLYDSGTATAPRVFRVYYRPAIVDQRKVRAFPAGLKMVAGDMAATRPQRLGVTAWACSIDGPEVPVREVPTCRGDQPLRLRITFPSCWDGKRLDSRNHRSHMAYPVRRACPADHHVVLPQLTFSIRFRVAGGAGISLACGNAYCAHADFFNAWKSSTQRRLVRSCIRAGVSCGSPTTTSASASASALRSPRTVAVPLRRFGCLVGSARALL
ncbi:MAG: hypothetical protein QOJ63_2197 [Solirubrobacteraceae bacterium]|nr:hypothetical protein [Solirubrobacteraceae bacterium]